MSASNHHPHHAEFPKLQTEPIVYCPATAFWAPRPHHMPANEAHIYFVADAPECMNCVNASACQSHIAMQRLAEESVQPA